MLIVVNSSVLQMRTAELFSERPREVALAVEHLAVAGAEERGAVFTRREVVEFMLDLIHYCADQNLAESRLLEPSFGHGEFILAASGRLLQSFFNRGGVPETAVDHLADALRAVELHHDSFEKTRQRLKEMLLSRGLSVDAALDLIEKWLIQDDFLLTDLPCAFTHVVGNPPYLRQESIPDTLLKEYRRRYRTIYDRADLYVPFIERGLRLLQPGGVLVFICADRWMKNKYGGPLRQLISEGYHLTAYVDMVDTPAFEGAVTAYPAIFRLERRSMGETGRRKTLIAERPSLEPSRLQLLARAMSRSVGDGVFTDLRLRVAQNVVEGRKPWLFDATRDVQLLRQLEKRYPSLEEAGCRVGIGVATGADKVFIRPMSELPVENQRKLPMVMAPDLRSGSIEWSGKGLLNPFELDGSLALLENYPRFATFLKEHEAVIKKRHVAKKNPKRWYRTIDRVYPELTAKPKLLIPDIKGAANVVYDAGQYYPHHNLYYVVSDTWDLRTLQAVLRSSVAEFFVALYSVKMRGGYLRFQAQYLRRIRLPHWKDVPEALRDRLRAASEDERSVCDAVTFDLYKLTIDEQEIVKTAVYQAERATI